MVCLYRICRKKSNLLYKKHSEQRTLYNYDSATQYSNHKKFTSVGNLKKTILVTNFTCSGETVFLKEKKEKRRMGTLTNFFFKPEFNAIFFFFLTLFVCLTHSLCYCKYIAAIIQR